LKFSRASIALIALGIILVILAPVWKWAMFYALDRKTSQNVTGYDKIKNREGYSILLPMGTREQAYPIWDTIRERRAI